MSLYLGKTKIAGVNLGESGVENPVSYDEQNPTTSQQAQARENIDVYSKAEVDNKETGLDDKIAAKADKSYVDSNFAPVIKDTLTGEAVATDMVSPVEHDVECRVEPINFFNIQNVKDNDSGTLTVSNEIINLDFAGTSSIRTKAGEPNTLSDLCPALKAGDEVYFRADTTAVEPSLLTKYLRTISYCKTAVPSITVASSTNSLVQAFNFSCHSEMFKSVIGKYGS